MGQRDGGPAFPRPTGPDVDGDSDPTQYAQHGMSLRDFFAAMALIGVYIVDDESRRQVHEETGADDGGSTAAEMATYAYVQADAMLAEREKGGA